MGFLTKDYVLGIDIGSSSVKYAGFSKKEGGLRLIAAGIKEIKSAGDAGLYAGEIISALKGIARTINAKNAKVIAVINCPQTAIKKITVPYMPKAELQNGIMLEAKNYFPFPIDNAMLDFEITGETVEKGVRKYEVVVATAPKTTVEKYMAFLDKAGLKPTSLVPAHYILQKAAEAQFAGEDKTWTAIDIGMRHTEMVIVKGRNLVFSRKIPVTGEDFTRALTSVLASDRGKVQLTREEAEKIKRETGIPEENGSNMILDKVSASQVLSMLRAPLENIANEIARCFDYYREESGGGKVELVKLYGGGASLRGLPSFLSKELGVRAELGDPFEKIELDKHLALERDKVSYQMALAIGAALTEGKGVNLLPREMREAAKMVIKRGTIEGVATAVILVCVLLYIGMRIQLGSLGERIEAAKNELSSLQPAYQRAEAYHLAGAVLIDEPHWQDIFMELSHIVPEKVYLTGMSMENRVITMKGVAASKDGDKILSGFIFSLENGIFNSVRLVKSRDLPGDAGNEFELKCWVD